MRRFHLVRLRPWPFVGSVGALGIISGLIYWFQTKELWLVLLSQVLILLTMYLWWRDVIRESNSYHTNLVVKNLYWGMSIFIISEILFFFSFFIAFFNRRISPVIELGACWPPCGVETINPFRVPLLNTIVLLRSGVTVTWSHHRLLNGNYKISCISLLLTVILGFYFTSLQILEYYEAPFSIADSVYGSTFFVMTGFHGFHVLIGRVFLIVRGLRLYLYHFSNKHHTGFECAIWYWHFVDVVWLFLYICVYWWGR